MQKALRFTEALFAEGVAPRVIRGVAEGDDEAAGHDDDQQQRERAARRGGCGEGAIAKGDGELHLRSFRSVFRMTSEVCKLPGASHRYHSTLLLDRVGDT